MFALFFSLYLAMFKGTWYNYNLGYIANMIKPPLNGLGELITSIFNNVDTPMATLGDILSTQVVAETPNYLVLVAFFLALITSIGIVVMAVKGIKRIFAVFFTLGR